MQQLQDARDGGTERYCVLQNRSVAAASIDLADETTWCVSVDGCEWIGEDGALRGSTYG